MNTQNMIHSLLRISAASVLIMIVLVFTGSLASAQPEGKEHKEKHKSERHGKMAGGMHGDMQGGMMQGMNRQVIQRLMSMDSATRESFVQKRRLFEQELDKHQETQKAIRAKMRDVRDKMLLGTLSRDEARTQMQTLRDDMRTTQRAIRSAREAWQDSVRVMIRNADKPMRGQGQGSSQGQGSGQGKRMMQGKQGNQPKKQ